MDASDAALRPAEFESPRIFLDENLHRLGMEPDVVFPVFGDARQSVSSIESGRHSNRNKKCEESVSDHHLEVCEDGQIDYLDKCGQGRNSCICSCSALECVVSKLTRSVL